ncbi:MAG TPA: TMEM165/GDT1 family protein [bacterium]|nr:TMEM165/GDT1 family protein [archaeon]HEC39415.1 TMEM165/GDT1 family protein [bacterium]
MDWIILLTTFGLLFLGELGDKTQLIVFNLSLEQEKPYKVGIGATLGFAVIVTLGVFIGAVLTKFIPLSVINIISGIMFIVIGLLGIPGIKKIYNEKKNRVVVEEINDPIKVEEFDNNNTPTSMLSKVKKNGYLAGFFSIFIMELGDKTQILTITLASKSNSPIEVWIGSFLALITLAWLGVFFGALIAKKIPKFYLKLGSVIIFITIGVIILLTSI